MLEMLVQRRDTLMLGDIVPLGDLWDVVADGEDTFSDVLKIRFDHAKKLYKTKLLPMLEEQHSVDLEVDRERANADPDVARKFQAFENDNRLIKSLLLSALVEGEETLKDMTCSKLAALNHGSVKSRFSGREYQTVKNKFIEWKSLHGEIRMLVDATDPVVSLELVGIDTDSIIKSARAYDRPGERQQTIKRMLLTSFGMPTDVDKTFFPAHKFWWRGTQRYCDVLFENVCRTTDEALRSSGSDWKLVIDYPFDNEGLTSQHDIDRIAKFKEKGESHKTMVWLPEFFSPKTQTELGQLVVIDHLLRGNSLDQHASDLSAQDRETARTILKSRHSALESKLQAIVEAAYGIRTSQHPGSLDDSYDISDSQFSSLFPSLALQRPVGSTLDEAMEHLLFQALAQYKGDCDLLPGRLQLILQKLGVSEEHANGCDRVKTAKAARDFFHAIEGKEPTPMVKAIAAARIETSSKALARSVKSAAAVLSSLLEPNRWELFEAVADINDKRKTDATLLLDDLRDSLKMDEFALAVGLPAKLSDAEGRAVKLLRPPKVEPPSDDADEPRLPPTKPGWKRLDCGSTERMSGSDLSALTEILTKKLEENPKRRVTVQWTLEKED